MGNKLLAVVASVQFLAGVPAFAHHAFSSEFDTSKPITLEGVVTDICRCVERSRFDTLKNLENLT
jgi:hypothetical protein